MSRIKEHPDSPIKRSEILVDETHRSYVIFEGAAYRVKPTWDDRFVSYSIELDRPYSPVGTAKPAFPKRKRASRNPLPRK